MTDKLHPTDLSLLNAAAGKSGGLVTLTPTVMAEIGKAIDTRTADIEARYPKLVEECDYETKLAVTAWVMKHIVDHAQSGGTFRYLIYTRLGFNQDAYVPLYLAGGMTISNEFDLENAHEEATTEAPHPEGDGQDSAQHRDRAPDADK